MKMNILDKNKKRFLELMKTWAMDKKVQNTSPDAMSLILLANETDVPEVLALAAKELVEEKKIILIEKDFLPKFRLPEWGELLYTEY